MLTFDKDANVWKRFCDLCDQQIPVGKLPITGQANSPRPPGTYKLDYRGQKVEVVLFAFVSDQHKDVCENCLDELIIQTRDLAVFYQTGVV